MVALVGIGFALLAATAIATTSMLIRYGSESGSSSDAVAMTFLVNLLVLPLLTVTFHGPDYGLTPRSIAVFVAAGLLGTMVARVLYFVSIDRLGSSRTEPIKASQPLHATVVAVLVLGESLTIPHLIGIVLIVVGVAVVSWETIQESTAAVGDTSWFALSIPLAAAFVFGLEPILAKIGFAEGTPVLVGLSLKVIAAAGSFYAYLWYRNDFPTVTSVVENKWFLVAGVSNTVFLLSYYAALDAADVVVAIPIVQTSPLFVVLFSFVFLQRLEHVTLRLGGGAFIIVAGAVFVTVFG